MHKAGDYVANDIATSNNINTPAAGGGLVVLFLAYYGFVLMMFLALAFIVEYLVIRKFRAMFTNLYDRKGWKFMDLFAFRMFKG